MSVTSIPQLPFDVKEIAGLANFACRARLAVTGREKLRRTGDLAMVLLARDIAPNSRDEVLRDLHCPVYQCCTGGELGRFFGLENCRMVGIRRSSIADGLKAKLSSCRLTPPPRFSSCPKVAVLGASGIGAYHAAWWELDGAQVVAILGATPESAGKTAENLATRLKHGRPNHYCSLEELLEKEQPEIVDICLPEAMHHTAITAALKHKCAVICEKPLFYNPELPSVEIYALAQEALSPALQGKGYFGLCSQYYLMARKCRSMCLEALQQCSTLELTLHAPLKHHPAGAESAWMDLAPHLIAALQAISPACRIDHETLKLEREEESSKMVVSFQAKPASEDAAPMQCRIEVQHLPEDSPDSRTRKMIIDGCDFQCLGARDESGVFQAQLVKDGAMPGVICRDFLRETLRAFRNGKATISPLEALENLQMLLKIREMAFNK